MLVIQIALGIVLGWLIISRFDSIIESIFDYVSGFLRIILFPFKLILKILKATTLDIKELLIGLVCAVIIFFICLILIAIVLSIAYGFFMLYMLCLSSCNIYSLFL